MSGYSLDGYIDVPSRIKLFLARHPEGSLQMDEPQFVEVVGLKKTLNELKQHRNKTRIVSFSGTIDNALAKLETQQTESREQVDLFAPPPEAPEAAPSAVEALLRAIDPDALSPREALDALYQLKNKLDKQP